MKGSIPTVAPVTIISAEHVTSFASLIVPPDIRSPEEVSQMRTAQNNLSAVRKFCAYLAAYDLASDPLDRPAAGAHCRDDAAIHAAAARCQAERSRADRRVCAHMPSGTRTRSSSSARSRCGR